MEGVTRSTTLTAAEVSKLEALVSQLNQVVGQFRLRDGRTPAEEEPAIETGTPPTGTTMPAAPSMQPSLEEDAERTLTMISQRPDRAKGELSLEAMMNPQPPKVQPQPAPHSGLAPLPPGSKGPQEDEDAA